MALVVCCEHCQVDCISPCIIYIHICKKLSVQVCQSDLGSWVIPVSTNKNIILCSYYVGTKLTLIKS